MLRFVFANHKCHSQFQISVDQATFCNILLLSVVRNRFLKTGLTLSINFLMSESLLKITYFLRKKLHCDSLSLNYKVSLHCLGKLSQEIKV